ncbi:MAG: AAA family ATPase [Deltaproteobacteria bacterium CG2_30_63_29]|nr:MAG: AAA family ATPase [Deltaproteobacteria bacterium CG2_30_63_29]
MSSAARPEKDSKRSVVSTQIDEIRDRINRARRTLATYFVNKAELIDLMTLCALAQEPLLLIGRPGTAKSDLVVKFCEALGLTGDEYFEYMLTKFTEPSEIIGPIDINLLKDGKYHRRVEGKLPCAKVVFLDEIFKSNSAILNTLLTVINERKFYQEGRPEPVEMRVLFAATNEIPEFSELDALKDRFILKAESTSVRDIAFDDLIEKGLRNEMYRVGNRKPWAGLTSLDDFERFKAYVDQTMLNAVDEDAAGVDRQRYFPDEVFSLFKRIIRTLEREEHIEISDRKVIKLYRLMRVRAFLFHGGVVTREELGLLKYVANRQQDIELVRNKVTALLAIEDSR